MPAHSDRLKNVHHVNNQLRWLRVVSDWLGNTKMHNQAPKLKELDACTRQCRRKKAMSINQHHCNQSCMRILKALISFDPLVPILNPT